MEANAKPLTALELLIAAYKRRMAKAAEDVGDVASWGAGQPISLDEEDAKLAGHPPHRAELEPVLVEHAQRPGDDVIERVGHVVTLSGSLNTVQVNSVQFPRAQESP